MAGIPLRRSRRSPLQPDSVRATARRWLAPWSRLTPADRDALVDGTVDLDARLRWEAARGFTLTDEARTVVAAHAALMVLHLADGSDSYAQVSSVILHAGTIVRRGERTLGSGQLHTDSPSTLQGEAHHRGPVLLSWSAVRAHALHPGRGENVLFHEFAHRLDMLDGVLDGTPPLADAAALHRWTTICTDALERLRAGDGEGVLRPYAATNPTEFFAVATEVFFTRPDDVRAAEPALYEVLRDFYGFDLAAPCPP